MRTIPRLLHRSHVPNNLIDPSIRERAETKEGNSREQQPPATQNMWHGLAIGLTVVICLAFSGSPTIVLLRHARIANIARVFDERTSVPAGRSLSRCRISSRSINIFAPSQGHASDERRTRDGPWASNSVVLLTGCATSLSRRPAGWSSSTATSNPICCSTLMFSSATSSSAAVSSSTRGLYHHDDQHCGCRRW